MVSLTCNEFDRASEEDILFKVFRGRKKAVDKKLTHRMEFQQDNFENGIKLNTWE